MRVPTRIQPDPAAALSQAVAALIQRALRYADEVHNEGSPRGYVIAVHEFRKALRRARGIVALARPVCEPERHLQVSALLREAFRSTGALRDSAVRLKLLEELDRTGRLDPAGSSLRQSLKSDEPTGSSVAVRSSSSSNFSRTAESRSAPVLRKASRNKTEIWR